MRIINRRNYCKLTHQHIRPLLVTGGFRKRTGEPLGDSILLDHSEMCLLNTMIRDKKIILSKLDSGLSYYFKILPEKFHKFTLSSDKMTIVPYQNQTEYDQFLNYIQFDVSPESRFNKSLRHIKEGKVFERELVENV